MMAVSQAEETSKGGGMELRVPRGSGEWVDFTVCKEMISMQGV